MLVFFFQNALIESFVFSIHISTWMYTKHNWYAKNWTTPTHIRLKTCVSQMIIHSFIDLIYENLHLLENHLSYSY